VSFSGQGRYNKNKLNVNGQTVSSDTYITNELTNYAVRFLKKEHYKPFMLYLSHKAVHAPFTPAKRHANLYSDIEIKSRHNPKDNLNTKPKWGRKMDKNWKSQILNYYRSLIAVDESIGRVYKTLEQTGVLDNTVIIFAGDNGYFHGEHGGMWDKRAAYEPSMRIPLIMRYPPLVKTSTECEEMVLNIDLAPTILELASVPIPDTMQGQSWLSVLKGRPGRKSFLYEYFQETDRRFKRPTVIAVRTRQWKYVTYPLDNTLTSELYNLRTDPEELDNLVGNPEYADITEQMKKELTQLQKKTGFRYPE
jgi:N-acetylglucosamine-6-sulfatase